MRWTPPNPSSHKGHLKEPGAVNLQQLLQLPVSDAKLPDWLLKTPKTDLEKANEAAEFREMQDTQRKRIEQQNAAVQQMRLEQERLLAQLAQMENEKKEMEAKAAEWSVQKVKEEDDTDAI